MRKNNPRWIILHCTDYSYRLMKDQFLACNGWHRDRDFSVSSLGYYVGYQRLITGGKNNQARLDTDEGCHTNQVVDGVSMNIQSLAVCVGFDGDLEFPLPEDYALLQKQVWDWMDQYMIPPSKIKFHRHFAVGKTCPGSLITDQWLSDLLKRPLPVPPPESVKLNECLATVDTQKKQITLLQSIIESIKNFLNKK